MAKDKCVCEKNPFVGIAGALGGILFVVIVMILIFAKEQAVSLIVPVVWAFVVLGIFLGLFALLAGNKKK